MREVMGWERRPPSRWPYVGALALIAVLMGVNWLLMRDDAATPLPDASPTAAPEADPFAQRGLSLGASHGAWHLDVTLESVWDGEVTVLGVTALDVRGRGLDGATTTFGYGDDARSPAGRLRAAPERLTLAHGVPFAVGVDVPYDCHGPVPAGVRILFDRGGAEHDAVVAAGGKDVAQVVSGQCGG